MTRSQASASRWIRSGDWSHPASPFFQVAAVFWAYSAGVIPLRAACSFSIHGSKSFGRSLGKFSSRFPMSPLGSMMIAGIPSIAASSSSVTPSPVLPDPVIPTMTPCVVRSLLSYSSGSASSSPVSASRSRPR